MFLDEFFSKQKVKLIVFYFQVIIRWWKISIRNSEGALYPNEIKDSYEDFLYDEVARREVWRIFGGKTFDYALNIVQGHVDWLTRLPVEIQIKIFSNLNLDDIPQVSLVSKLFRSLCRNNDLWKLFYIRQHGSQSLENKDLINLAERRGWRQVFFTNRLKLQMELRREARLEKHHRDDPSDLLKARQRRSQVQQNPIRTPDPSNIGRHSFSLRKNQLDQTSKSVSTNFLNSKFDSNEDSDQRSTTNRRSFVPDH